LKKGIASRFGVKSYPTIKFYRDGVARDYKEDRTFDALVRYGKTMTRNPVQGIDSKSLLSFSPSSSSSPSLSSYPVTFVFFGQSNTPEGRAYEQVARLFQGRMGFLRLDDDDNKGKYDVRKKFSIKYDSSVLSLSKGSDPEMFTSSTIITLTKLQKEKQNSDNHEDVSASAGFTETRFKYWVEQNSMPIMSEMGPHNFEDLTGIGKLVVFCVTDPEAGPHTSKYLTDASEVAKKHRDSFVFANVDGVKYTKYVSQFGLDPELLPTMFVFDYPNERYWTQEPREGKQGVVVRSRIEMFDFLDDVISGKILPKGTHAWWSPVKLYRNFEKWLSGFSETQLMVGIAIVMLTFFGLMFAACYYTLGGGDEPSSATPTPTPTTTSSSPPTTTMVEPKVDSKGEKKRSKKKD